MQIMTAVTAFIFSDFLNFQCVNVDQRVLCHVSPH